MASNQYNAADLTSVLRTLSALSNSSSTPTGAFPDVSHFGPSVDGSNEPGDTLRTGTANAAQYGPSNAAKPSTGVAHRQMKSLSGQQPTATADHGAVDPSAITSWPAALRYVMRVVSRDDELQQRIRRLIQSQHDHERQWWQGREALIEKQKARVEKKKQLDDVLRSVGAPVDATKVVTTAEEDQAELYRYDTKVYRASVQMAAALDSELRSLRIPFFVIKSHLVSEQRSLLAETKPKSKDGTDQEKKSGPISREELIALQRRMLDLLQDLCKE